MVRVQQGPPQLLATMTAPLPNFRYNPDPISTGSVVPSKAECVVCHSSRGFLYSGPVYAEVDVDVKLCPWCIANGRAHDELGAEFTDGAGVGDYGTWEAVRDEIRETVAFRTPGFSGWQQERWFTCCGDAAAFLGRAGREELEKAGVQAVEAIRSEIGYTGSDWENYFAGMSRDGQPTAYLFRCLHCGKYGGYSDFT